MKAIILAGEREEGLSPLTLEQPRCLLPLFGKPLLDLRIHLLYKSTHFCSVSGQQNGIQREQRAQHCDQAGNLRG